MIFGKYTNKKLSKAEIEVAKKLVANNSSLIPETRDVMLNKWRFNQKNNQIVIPFDSLESKVLFENENGPNKFLRKANYLITETEFEIRLVSDIYQNAPEIKYTTINDSFFKDKFVQKIIKKFPDKKIRVNKSDILQLEGPKGYKFLKRPDYVIAEIGRDIILKAVDSKSYNLEGHNNIGQISALNLHSIIQESQYFRHTITELEKLFPHKEIKLQNGYFILNKRKILTDQIERYFEIFLKNKSKKGILYINDEGIHFEENGEDFIDVEGNFETEIISVERFHNDLSKIKNHVEDKGYYHTSAIAVSGFNDLGEAIKRMEYSQEKGLKTYSPELEEIDGIIKSILTWEPTKIIEERKKLEKNYFDILNQKLFNRANSIDKSRKRINEIQVGIRKRNERINDLGFLIENLEQKHKNDLDVYVEIEKILNLPLVKNEDVGKYILALNALKSHYDVNEKFFNEIINKFKNVREGTFKEKKTVLSYMKTIFNFIFPELRPKADNNKTIPGITSIVYDKTKNYLARLNNLNNEITALNVDLGFKIESIDDSVLMELERVELKQERIVEENEFNKKKYEKIKKILEKSDLNNYEFNVNLFNNLTPHLMLHRYSPHIELREKKKKEKEKNIEELVSTHKIKTGFDTLKTHHLNEIIFKTIIQKIEESKAKYLASHNRYLDFCYKLKNSNSANISKILIYQKIKKRENKYFKEIDEYQKLLNQFWKKEVENQEFNTYLREHVSLKKDELKKIKKKISKVGKDDIEAQKNIMEEMEEFIKLSLPGVKWEKGDFYQKLTEIIEDIQLDDQNHYAFLNRYYNDELTYLKEKGGFQFKLKKGLYYKFEKEEEKLKQKLKEYKELKNFISDERTKYHHKFEQSIKKTKYESVRKMQDELITLQEEMKEKALHVMHGKEKVLRGKHRERLERDKNLNNNIDIFNMKLEYHILPSSGIAPLIVYLDLDPQRKEVCKLTFYDYKTIHQI